jgi:hypothetical protein
MENRDPTPHASSLLAFDPDVVGFALHGPPRPLFATAACGVSYPGVMVPAAIPGARCRWLEQESR